MADTSQMVCACEGHDACTMLCHALKRQLHRLHANDLSKTLLAIQSQQHTCIDFDRNAAIGFQVAFQNRIDITWCHTHAVRVVPT